jgi:hypothetical protein
MENFNWQDKRNLSMLADFYEFTMANGFLENKMEDRIAYFDMFFREIPENGGFAIWSVCACNFSSLRLLASPWISTSLVTIFVASPPDIKPILAVVSSSILNNFILLMASAAI